MAEYNKNWVTYDTNAGGIIGTPSQDIINFTAAAHTGRNDRQLSFTITADNPSTDDTFSKNFNIRQTGKPLYITFDSKGFTITNSTTYIMIEGVTNTPFLSIDTATEAASNILGQGEVIITATSNIIPIKYFNETLYNKVPNDPGAISAYRFAIKVPIPENPDITKQQIIDYEIIIGIPSSDNLSINNTISSIVRVFQGYDYTLNVSPTTLEFDSAGGTKSVAVTSNVNWTIS